VVGDSFVDLIGWPFANDIRLSGGLGLVALDVETLNEETVNGDEITRLKVNHVAHQNVVNRKLHGLASSNDFDIAILLLLVKACKLAFFRVVVD